VSQYLYDLGDVARISVTFEQGGSPVDPSTLSFEVMTPTEAMVLIEWAGSPGSPADEIVHDGTGEYHIDLSLDVAGTYTYRWLTTGTAQAAIYGSFRVPSFVSLQQAKDHIRDTTAAGASSDADLLLKLDAAEAAILDYIGATAYWATVRDGWTNATVPAFVRAAILLQFAELCRFRGDDEAGQVPPRDPAQDFSPTIVALLRRTRDPVVQ
jgi:hypothetical protein